MFFFKLFLPTTSNVENSFLKRSPPWRASPAQLAAVTLAVGSGRAAANAPGRVKSKTMMIQWMYVICVGLNFSCLFSAKSRFLSFSVSSYFQSLVEHTVKPRFSGKTCNNYPRTRGTGCQQHCTCLLPHSELNNKGGCWRKESHPGSLKCFGQKSFHGPSLSIASAKARASVPSICLSHLRVFASV